MKHLSINKFQFKSSDYDEFGSLLKIANVEEKILESGSFLGMAKGVQTDRMTLLSFDINRKVLQQGAGTPGYVTFTIWEPDVLFSWRNQEMKGGMIGVLWNREHMSVTGSEFRAIPISIEEKFFKKLCLEKGYFDLVGKLRTNEILFVSELELQKIRNMIRFIIEDNSLDDSSLTKLIEEKLLNQFVDCLGSTLSDKKELDLTHWKMNLVIDYIHGNISNLSSLHQVSRGTQIPERTIRRLINNKFQISPKQYLNKLRLNDVRKGLLNDQCNSSIYQVASDFNFWHMGQFSKDYKNLFGELPSETVRKRHS